MCGDIKSPLGKYRESHGPPVLDDAEEHFIKAKKLSIQGRREEAIEEYRKVLAMDPEHRRAKIGIDLIAALWGVHNPKGR